MENRTEQDYYKIREAAFNTAMFLLKDCNDADDIAQNVCLKYLRSKQEITNEIAWGQKVARNEAYALAKRKKLEITAHDCKLEYLENKKEDQEEITPEFDTITKIEAKELLSKEDYKHYRLMIKYEQNVTKIAQHLRRTKSYVYGLNYRVKRNLVSAKLLKEGYRGTKAIVGYKLHQNILNFIKTLQKKMKENDLQSMHNYFKGIDVSKIPQLDIAKMIDYHIFIKEKGIYRLTLPYFDSNNNVKFCMAYFMLEQNSNIKITKFNSKMKSITKVNCTREELERELKPMKKGMRQESMKELHKIAEKINRKNNKEITLD